ncbi:MAG TPA: adenosylmethionine--8-amino-7-oxononanoate transaminase [Thermodesulfobacteriota bacterium]|nr:adenosylmethionine--8-amino-7-oxononanoate transaminase [Thermodesulfobacteriota bacterium]
MRQEAPEWGRWDARHVWHPYTPVRLAPPPVPVVRAAGAYLYTADGRAILDAISSWWVTLHGHAHPAIAAAVARQAAELEQVIFAGFTHRPAAELARRLVGLLPEGLTRVFYSDDGSTAVEVALKLALQFWANRGEPRRRLVTLEHAYHGDTVGAMSVGARSVFTEPFRPLLFDVEVIPSPAEDAAGALAALEALLARRGREIAALIVEPLVQAAGGMRIYAPETLRAIRQLTAAYDVLLIADEVMTGFGRTGAMFACGLAGVRPDLLCVAKGLTGGFLPLAATACTERIYEAFATDDVATTFFHGHSYAGSPLGCAAALASLALFERERTFERIGRIAEVHRARLAALAGRPGVRETRQCGTVAVVEVATDAPGYTNAIGRRIAARALERGVLLRPLGQVVYVLPPYCITDEELHRVYDVIEDCLADLGR